MSLLKRYWILIGIGLLILVFLGGALEEEGALGHLLNATEESKSTDVKADSTSSVDDLSFCERYECSDEPSGPSAKCKDGTFSYSRSRSGTCSWHGGVAVWY